MPDNLVPTVNTPVTPVGFARAVIKVWPGITKEGCGVLYAQYALETGAGKACWNWNIGNVKYTRGCGYDYVALVRNKEATPDGRFYETAKTDPASWFRAYPNFEAGMKAFVTSKTTGQWASTKPFIERGDPEGYAAELKRHRYYTAPLDMYQKAMRTWFERWKKMGAWEEAVEPPRDTIPVPAAPPSPDTLPDFAVVYAMPDPPKRELVDPDAPPDSAA